MDFIVSSTATGYLRTILAQTWIGAVKMKEGLTGCSVNCLRSGFGVLRTVGWFFDRHEVDAEMMNEV